MKIFVPIIAVASLAACSSLTPVNDPVYLRLTDLEARLIRIERVLENESLIALAGDINSLRTDVQSLLGEVETLRFDLESQAAGQRDLYVDLDQRLADIEAMQTQLQSMPGGGSTGFSSANVSDQTAYESAFALIQSRNYPQAQSAFESFLASYSASNLRSNAQYWLAEMHYVQRSFSTALVEFEKVISNYPQSDKVPDALLKIGFSNFELRNFTAARQALLRVMREFPGTSAADSAEQRLSQIPE